MKFNWCKSGFLSKEQNKAWEIQICNDFEGPYFNISLKWTRKCDHAGLNLTIEILSFYFCVQIYDTRHWDYANGVWTIPSKEDQ